MHKTISSSENKQTLMLKGVNVEVLWWKCLLDQKPLLVPTLDLDGTQWNTEDTKEHVLKVQEYNIEKHLRENLV